MALQNVVRYVVMFKFIKKKSLNINLEESNNKNMYF